MRSRERKIVLLDVDYTVSKIDGQHFLADRKKVLEEVNALTQKGLSNEMSFGSAMRAKIDLIQPSKDDMDLLAQEYLKNITGDTKQVVEELKRAGIEVGLLTASFFQALLPVAEELGIKPEHVYANKVLFTDDGQYAGYEDNLLMSFTGKTDVIKERIRPNFRRITMIGDGAIDLNTVPEVDRFIGFGGANQDQVVKDKADVYIASPTLAPVLRIELPFWRRGVIALRRRDGLMRRARKATVIKNQRIF